MTSMVLDGNGGTFQRTVRSTRKFHDKYVGAIKDKGYLVLVTSNHMYGAWTPMRVIRKLK